MSEYYYGVGIVCEVPAGFMDVEYETRFMPGIVDRDGKKYEGTVLFKDVEAAVAEKEKWHKPKERKRAFIYRIKLAGNIELL